MLVVGSLFLGLLGVWKLAAVFPHQRARIVALVAYAATPLVPGLVSTGRLGGVFAYAALPWFVHLLRRALGIGTVDPALADDDVVDGVIEPPVRERVRRTAVLAMVSAVAIALAPPLLLVLALVVIVVAVATFAAGAGVRTSVWTLGTGGAALFGAFLLEPAALGDMVVVGTHRSRADQRR